MQSTLKIPLAVGAGYLLGRKRKMRWAVAAAVGAATGGFGGVAGRALKFGGKQLASSDALTKLSPELGHVADEVRGDLAHAGKAAAKAAITSRIDVLANSLHDRTQALAQQAEPEGADGHRDDEGEDDEAQDDEAQEAHADHRGSRDQDQQPDDRERTASGERPGSRERPDSPERPGPRERSGSRERPGPRERSGSRERPGPRERRMRDSGAEVDDR